MKKTIYLLLLLSLSLSLIACGKEDIKDETVQAETAEEQIDSITEPLEKNTSEVSNTTVVEDYVEEQVEELSPINSCFDKAFENSPLLPKDLVVSNYTEEDIVAKYGNPSDYVNGTLYYNLTDENYGFDYQIHIGPLPDNGASDITRFVQLFFVYDFDNQFTSDKYMNYSKAEITNIENWYDDIHAAEFIYLGPKDDSKYEIAKTITTYDDCVKLFNDPGIITTVLPYLIEIKWYFDEIKAYTKINFKPTTGEVSDTPAMNLYPANTEKWSSKYNK